MTLAYVLPFTITLHLAYAGARVTLSLMALNLQASPFTVGILLSLLAFLPMTFSIIVATSVARRFIGRFGAGRVLAGGMTLVAIGMVLFSTVPADGTFLADVFLPGVITALGLGFSFVPVTIAAMAGVEAPQSGLASGLVNTSRQFGGSLGLAILATIASQHTRTVAGGGRIDGVALTAGFHSAFLVGAGFAVVGALVAAGSLARTGAPAPQPAHAEA